MKLRIRFPLQRNELRTDTTSNTSGYIPIRTGTPMEEGVVERSCQRCGERFEANRADRIYCSAACKQAAVRARRGVRVARRHPEPPEVLDRLAEIEERQRVILTDLDHLEETIVDRAVPDAPKVFTVRLEEIERRLDRMEKAMNGLSSRQRKHEAALTSMAQLLAAEPWRV